MAQRASEKADKENQSAAKKDQKLKPDTEQLQGAWKVVKAVTNGKKEFDDADLDATMTVRSETLFVKVTKRGQVEKDADFFVFKLDATTTPKLIDLADWEQGFEANDKVIEGVYSLDGDTLMICFRIGAFSEYSEIKNRPPTLESKEGSNTTVWTLKKQKKGR